MSLIFKVPSTYKSTEYLIYLGEFNSFLLNPLSFRLTNKHLVFILFSLSFFLISRAQESYVETLKGTEANLPMVFIKGGTFTMGSPDIEEGRLNDEGPMHQVEVASFWMGQLEVSWDLYNLFVSRELDANQIAKSESLEVNHNVDAVSGATTPYVEMSFGMGVEGYPAIGMTQLAAVKFCEWLSAMTGHFYRLPTEAEWEYACRAGSSTAYNFGNNLDDLESYAWFDQNSEEAYHKIGTKKPNTWGLYDMHGNVAEWTLDQYDSTAYGKRNSVTVNPLEKGTTVYPKVVRGGSWVDGPEKLRSAARQASSKTWKKRDPQMPKSKWWHTDAPFVGFRVVRPEYTPSLESQKTYWNYETHN